MNRFDYDNWNYMYLKHRVVRTFFTWEDVYVACGGNSNKGPFDAAATNFNISKIGLTLYGSDVVGSDPIIHSVEVSKLFNEFILPAYWEEAITFSDEYDEITPENRKEILERLFAQMVAWVRRTGPAYLKEIRLYAEIENNLMDSVGQTSSVKYNDTPQITGGLDSDNYATNITVSETKTDVSTKIDRLAEIREKIRNVYEKWSDEFRVFIIW